MKLYIPRLGDTLKLTAPWSFHLMKQDKNESVWRLFNLPWNPNESAWSQGDIPIHMCEEHELIVSPKTDYVPGISWNATKIYHKLLTLPVDAQLKVERIYIRKCSPEFDSVTFSIVKKTIPNFTNGKARFWVKLDEVNTMECDKV